MNLIAFSRFARYLADVGKMWGNLWWYPEKVLPLSPDFPTIKKEV